jgi:hypothetical protein
MAIQTLVVDDQTFDAALEFFAVVGDQLKLKSELSRAAKDDEQLDRYAFTAFVEALKSEDFFEDPLETVLDLELTQAFESEDAAWEAIKDFYAERACTLLIVGHNEEFIVGDELLHTLGLISQ